MPTIIVHFQNGEHRIPYPLGQTLREILARADMHIRSGCSGLGQCGLCRVIIRSGNVAPPDQAECRLLGEDLLRNGLRLACRVTPCGDIHLEPDADSFKPAWQRIDNPASFPTPDLGPLATSSPDRDSCIGLGVDLGTTHLRLALWDLPSGIFVAGRTGLNPQAVFGADVLTRLTMAVASSETAARISRSAAGAIGAALADISLGDTLSLARIRHVVIVGNTAMLTLLCRRNYQLLLDPDNWMRQIDCTPQDALQWARIWGLGEGTRIEIVPPLAGFVGSDLLAGVLATGLVEGPAGSLLIDCGTNSEIALWDGNVLRATSAAGGPAFEGSGVGCGMPAEPGAIFKVHLPDASFDFVCEVIGGGEAQGICGSGLIDATACLLRAGIVNRAGNFSRSYGGTEIVLKKGGKMIALGKGDIDLLQRAKAAIGAATQCLVNRAGMKTGDIKRICVSGAFGSYLDVGNAQAIGLLPQAEVETVELCGNTALSGCRSLLLRGTSATNDLKAITEIVNMSSLPEFEERFIKNLYLGPMNPD